MSTSRYTPEMTALVIKAADANEWANDVAERLGVTLCSLQSKLVSMGRPPMRSRRMPQKKRLRFDFATFPKFENVTPIESRQVRADAPPPAAIRREDVERQSMVGNSSALCAAGGW